MTAAFTVDITGTTGMRTGEWAEGEEFSILPEERRVDRRAAGRVRLYHPDNPEVSPEGPELGGADGPRSAPAVEQRTLPPMTVAEVEERLRSGSDTPHPVLVLFDDNDKPAATAYPEEPGAAPRHFRVLDDQERELCRITHGASRPGRRGYWRIDLPDGQPPVVGYRGTWAGWLCYVLLLPLWALFFVGSLLFSLLSLGNVAELLVWGCPRSIAWRARGGRPGGRALTFTYLRTGYRWNDALLDERIAYLQATLHYFNKIHKD